VKGVHQGDHVLDTTGSPEMIRLGMDLLNPRGSVALLTGAQAVGSLVGGRRVSSVIQGDAVPQRFIPRLIRLYQAGRFPFDRLVKFYEFGDINRAIRDANQGVTIKPVVRIGMEQALT
jgi:aryl-alcohol dehydrogenase